MFFLELSYFLMLQQMLAIWAPVPLSFLNPAWISGSSWFTYCWNLSWRILSITLLVCETSAIVWQFEHSLALPFFGIGMKIDHFQSRGHCWVFQICWHIECNTFTATSLRIWNSSAEIPSPPPASQGSFKCGRGRQDIRARERFIDAMLLVLKTVKWTTSWGK